MDSPGIPQPPELLLAGFTELEFVAAGDQPTRKRRHEDLAAVRFGLNPRRKDHGVPEEVLLFADHLSGVQSDPDP